LRQDNRKKEHKKVVDVEDSRKKREEAAVALRNRVRAEQLYKKRRDMDGGVIPIDREGELPDEAVAGGTDGSDPPAPAVHISPELAFDILSDDPEKQLLAVAALRGIVSVEGDVPFQAIIDLGVVPRLVAYLGYEECPAIQAEATWVVANMASGRRAVVAALVNANAIQGLIPLLFGRDDAIREYAIWALANIAADNVLCRDIVFETCQAVIEGDGGLQGRVDFAQMPVGVVRAAAWAVAVVCRGQPPVRIVVVEALLPVVHWMLMMDDPVVLSEACWALVHMTGGPCEGVESVLKGSVLSRVAQLLMHDDVNVRVPALRVIGNISQSTDEHTAQLLGFGIVLNLARLLVAEIPQGIKEVCWVFSNIVLGPRAFADNLVGVGVIEAIAGLMSSPHFIVRKEAAWVVSNVVSLRVPELIDAVFGYGCLSIFCSMIDSPDTALGAVSMEAMTNMLFIDAARTSQIGYNRAARVIVGAGALDRIEELINHQTPTIAKRATDMIDAYFKVTGDDDNDVAPVAGAEAYKFGINPDAN
jgi:hypothetical protein